MGGGGVIGAAVFSRGGSGAIGGILFSSSGTDARSSFGESVFGSAKTGTGGGTKLSIFGIGAGRGGGAGGSGTCGGFASCGGRKGTGGRITVSSIMRAPLERSS